MRRRTWKTELTPLLVVTLIQFIVLRLMEWAPGNVETDEIAKILVHFNYFYAPIILTVLFIFFAYRLLRTLLDFRGVRLGDWFRANAIYVLLAAVLSLVGHLDQIVSLFSPGSTASLREFVLFSFLVKVPVVRWFFDLAGLLLLLFSLRASGPAVRTEPERMSAGDLTKTGDFGKAGDAFLKAGDVKGAKKAFRKGNLLHRLAALELREGNALDAAKLFEEAGSAYAFEAARAYETAGKPEERERALSVAIQDARATARWDRLVEAAEVAGNLEAIEEGARRLAETKTAGPGKTTLLMKAAQAAATRGNVLGAAELYRVIGDFTKAATFYKQAGKPLEAAKDFERGNDLLSAARCYLEAGNEKTAYELLARDAELKGDIDRAADAWLKAGSLDRAASLYERKGVVQKAGEIYFQLGKHDRAAPLLHKAGDLARAAASYEASGRLDMAAFLFRDQGKHEKAAQLFKSVGKVAEAAQCFEIMGKFDDAIPLYSRSSRGIDAARCALKAGHREQAWEHLVTVPRNTPGITQFFLHLAEAHLRASEPSDAVHVMRELLGTSFPQKTTLVEFETFSRALEASGDVLEAADIMARIAELDPSFRNAGQRATALATKASQTRRVSTAPPSPELITPGQFSAPPSRPHVPTTTGTFSSRTAAGSAFQPGRAIGKSTAFSLIQDPSVRYEILSELGRGGMGVVHKALDRKLDRYVALKILPATLWGDETAMRYFEREAKAIAALSHPNVVALYDFGEGFGSAYLAMEYLDGPTLQSLLKLDPERVQRNWRDYFIQAARGAAAAHAKGILHRDIKPANLMLDVHGTLRILDFGLARPESDSGLTSKLIGTPAFFPPELLRGESPTPASDVYSLGATFYTLATGRWPYVGDDVLVARLERDPDDPRAFAPFLGEDETFVLMKSMSRFRPERFQDAGQLLAALLAMDA